MDAYEATKIVYSRIQSLDPENAAKIMGLLLLQGDDKEMIRLAFLPEALVRSVVVKARNDLGLLPASPSSTRYTHPHSSPWDHPEELMAVGATNEADLFYSECRSPSGGAYGGGTSPWGAQQQQQRRGFSLGDQLYLGEGGALGWRPCLYYQRGYCKNGSMCRFQHGLPEDGKVDAAVEQQLHELLLRTKGQRLMPSAAPFGYGASLPSPTSAKCTGFFHHNDGQRAAAAMMLNGDEPHKFMGRHRVDYANMANPGSRQIYLTFPADSTFREEDVSNYFSIYGPVQDVRIPYQQKRMFGFVTFVYPETVKLILAKGNPHFVCDARVLVKPYKEKGKVPDKKLQQQQQQLLDRGDFSGCNSPTCLDSPYDLQQLGARVMFNNSQQEMLLRRKLEEQQQVADLQQAIELQQRRFMGLQLLDIKNGNLTLPISSLPSPSPISTPTTTPSTVASTCTDDFPIEEKCSSPVAAVGEEQKVAANTAASPPFPAAPNAADKLESVDVKGIAKGDGDFQESLDHNLPDSPFATSEATEISGITCSSPKSTTINSHLIASATPLFSATPALDMASYKSCFLHMPRFSPGHGAVGM